MIWQSYRDESGGPVFWNRMYRLVYLAIVSTWFQRAIGQLWRPQPAGVGAGWTTPRRLQK